MPKGKDYTPPIVCSYCHSSNVDVWLDVEQYPSYDGYCYECKAKTLTTEEEEGSKDE